MAAVRFQGSSSSSGSDGESFGMTSGPLHFAANVFAYCINEARNEAMEEALLNIREKASVSPATEFTLQGYINRVMIGGHATCHAEEGAKRAIGSSSFPSEEKEDSSDLHEFTERKMETVFSPTAGTLIPYPPTMKRGTEESFSFSMAVELAGKVRAQYNQKNKEWMKVIKIKEAFSQWEEGEQIFFILFHAELIPKDGKESWERDCRSVLFYDVQSHPLGLSVFYIKLGSWTEEDIKKWTKMREGRSVLYSESMKKEDTAEEAQSDNMEEDVDSDSHTTDDDLLERPRVPEAVCPLDGEDMLDDEDMLDGEDMLDDEDMDSDEDPCYDLIKADLNPRIIEFAMEAVANYNSELQEELPRMELGKIKEVFSRPAPEIEYHINFDARFIDEHGNETKQTPCRAVVATHFTGLVKVWYLRVGSPAGIGKDNWDEEDTCVYEFPPWRRLSMAELLKSENPEWCLSSDDEEDKKMKPGSSNQPPPASTHVEN